MRNVSPDTSHEELVAFVSQFGTVVAGMIYVCTFSLTNIVCFLSKFQQALVEMDTPNAASAVVMYSKTTAVFIAE